MGLLLPNFLPKTELAGEGMLAVAEAHVFRTRLSRVANKYWVCASTPLSVNTISLPLFRSPRHIAGAVRCMVSRPYG